MFACCNNLRGSIHYLVSLAAAFSIVTQRSSRDDTKTAARETIHYSDMPAIFLNTIPKKFNHTGKSLELYISEIGLLY